MFNGTARRQIRRVSRRKQGVDAKTAESKAEIAINTIGIAPFERVPRAHPHCEEGEDAECGDYRNRRPVGQGG